MLNRRTFLSIPVLGAVLAKMGLRAVPHEAVAATMTSEEYQTIAAGPWVDYKEPLTHKQLDEVISYQFQTESYIERVGEFEVMRSRPVAYCWDGKQIRDVTHKIFSTP